MPITLVITIVAFLSAALFVAKVLKFPKNIWLLFLAQPLAISASPALVFIGGILGSQLAPDPKLATLPLTTMILGVASTSIPAALLARRWGRKYAALTGFSFSFIGAVLAMFAAIHSLFWLLIAASFCVGINLSFVQQLRFAAIESVPDGGDTTKAISVLMFAGIFAAFLGPEIAVIGRDWIDAPHGYAGSFALLAIMVLAAMLVMLNFEEPQLVETVTEGETRPLLDIVKQPIFIISIISGAAGYSLMSLLMTATPISMHNMQGHGLNETKWVIQSHISAMYLPSLITPWLSRRFGLHHLLMAGSVMLIIVSIVALSGQQVMHYWVTLVLLGVGWNFLFLSATILLPQSYRNAERHKVQATNDFMIFFVQGLSSLLAGWLLFATSWQTLVYTGMPMVLLVLMSSVYYYRNRSKLSLV
ncbi:MAG: MFS family permease [Phenylobacterium sp.]|jgi:MFS family permease